MRGLWALNPAALFFGPVFQREARIQGRRGVTYSSRAGYALLVLVVVGIAFMGNMMDSDLAGGGAARLQRFQFIAPTIGTVIAWFQFVMLALIAPVLTGPAICDEKRNRTLAVLACTPLTSPQIVLSTLASRVMQLGILALIPVPLLLAVRIFGGLETEVVVGTTCIGLCSALLSASLGIFFSVGSRRAMSAVSLAIGTFTFFCFAPILYVLAREFLANGLSSPGPPSMRFVGLLSPGFAMAVATMPGLGGFFGGTWYGHCLLSLGTSALLCIASAVSLRRVIKRQAESDGPEANALRAPSRRTLRRAAAAARSAPPSPEGELPDSEAARETRPAKERTHARSRTVGDAPVLWRELRQPAIRHWFGRLAFWVMAPLVLFVAYYHGALQEDDFDSFVLVAGTLLATLFGCTATAGAVGAELQSRTWHVLLASPLTAREIIWGKFLGALPRQWPVPLFMFTHLVISCLAGHARFLNTLFAAWVLGVTLIFLCALGVFMSVHCRKATKTAVATFMVAASVWFIIPVTCKVIGELVRGGFLNKLSHLADYLVVPNPVILATMIARSQGRFDRDDYYLPNNQMLSTFEFGVLITVLGIVTLAISWLLLGLAARAFPKAMAQSGG
ncbi:MAG: ABC transporter permease [Phycisphaerales bacterium]